MYMHLTTAVTIAPYASGSKCRLSACPRHGLPQAVVDRDGGLPARVRASPWYPSRSPIAPTVRTDRVIVQACRSGANTTPAGTPSRLGARPSTFFSSAFGA